MTKVILNQTVPKLGIAGDIVDVKPGFARNYLIPGAYAVTWTKRAGEQVKLRQEAAKRRQIATIETAHEIKAKLETTVLTIALNASESGRLFGTVTGTVIANAVKEAFDATVDKRKITIGKPIKTLGPAEVTIQLLDNVVADVKINVVQGSKKAH